MLAISSNSREQEEAAEAEAEEDKENDAPPVAHDTHTNTQRPFLSMVDFLKHQQGANPTAPAPSDSGLLAKPTPARATPGKVPALAAALAEAGGGAGAGAEGDMADDLRLVEVRCDWSGWGLGFGGWPHLVDDNTAAHTYTPTPLSPSGVRQGDGRGGRRLP